METDKPFHLKITQEDGPRLTVGAHTFPLAGAVSKGDTWLLAIPGKYVDLEVSWTSLVVAALAEKQIVPGIPAEGPEPVVQEVTSKPATAPVQVAAAPVESKPAKKPATNPEPKQAPPVPPSATEMAELHDVDKMSVEDIAELSNLSPEEVREAIKGVVMSRVPVASDPQQTPVADGTDRRSEVLASSITTLALHANAERALQSWGIDTIGQLVKYTPSKLVEVPNMGVNYIKAVRSALAEKGLELTAEELALKDICRWPRPLGGLYDRGVKTVDQLCALTRSELAGTFGVSEQVVKDIEVELAKHGRKLAAE